MKTKQRTYLPPLILGGLFALLLLSACLSFGAGEGALINGVYEGSGRGYRGPVRVRVVTSPAGIEDIAIISHRDAPYPGGAAMEELLELVLETGSTDLDAVSGASFSSRGFLEAVEDALRQARERTRREAADLK